MAKSFFFYDLETSGFRSTKDRIMQFAGQRTDMDLKPTGKPYNVLVKLPPDILPQPSAVVFTGLSLKENALKGIPEYQFAKLFNEEIAQEGTIFVGFNNLRFDDEFIRQVNYRNFYDAYSWHWALSRSRWDLLDPIRMTRALRPQGIKWPFDEENKAVNKLEMLTKANKLVHEKAHDALSDVTATIELAKLIATKQPKLFNFLLNLRAKAESNKIINSSEPFVYTSGRYPSELLHTTIVYALEFDPKTSTAQVYDLRIDPRPLAEMNETELAESMSYDPDKTSDPIPIKTIKLNRCLAVAPLSVLDEESITRLKLDMESIKSNYQYIKNNRSEFSQKLKTAIGELNKNRDYRQRQAKTYADQKLYDNFISPADERLFPEARQLNDNLEFSEKRLNDLYFIYRARNYTKELAPEEQKKWHELVHQRLFSGEDSDFIRYKAALEEEKLANKRPNIVGELEELAKSIEDGYGTP